MTTSTLPLLVADDGAFRARCDELMRAPVVALDTEFMRVNTYFPTLCLIQVFNGAEPVCLDALEVASLAPLLDALDANDRPALMHSARQDLETFYVAEARLPDKLYDTQIAAALTGPDDQLSYAQLVQEVTGVELPKSQTRTNWAKRPLTEQQLLYAADDVVYLPQVQDALDEKLDKLGRRSWLEEDCRRLLDETLYIPDIDGAHRRCKSRRHLDDQQRGALHALCALRERTAIERNRPRKWIIDDAGLESLASLATPDADAVRRVLRKSRAHRALRVDRILDTISNAPPVVQHRPGKPSNEETALIKRTMSKLREVAEALDVAPGFLAPRRDVERLVRGERSGSLMCGWRRTAVGDALLDVVAAG